MPGRVIPLITGEIYHVLNRGIDNRLTCSNKREFNHIVQLLRYYRFYNIPVKYSVFRIWSFERRQELLNKLENEKKALIDILVYCFMSNHFHFLLRQKVDKGIAKFMSNFQNSYTRYFNTRNKRVGPLFLDQFKAVRIETDEQLIHVSRYIHLNPYSSFMVKTFEELKNYPWSSILEFLNHKKGFCRTEDILSMFKDNFSYEKFVINQAEYQRKLDVIKHLLLE